MEVLEFLIEKTINNRSIAYIVIDKNGYIKEWNDDISLYVDFGLEINMLITDCLHFLEGYFPLQKDEIYIPSIETTKQLYADVYLLKKGDIFYIILLDEAFFRKSIKKVLQNLNEEKLVYDKYNDLKNDLLIIDISAFLDLLILEHLGSNMYNIIGILPNWVDFVANNKQKLVSEVEISGRFPYIENFLLDAKPFWKNNTRGKLKSDLWTETDESNKEVHLEATAIKIKNRDFLLIEYGHSSTDEKFNLIQRARELKLEHELRIKAEETLNKQNIKLNELNATKDKFFSIIAHDLRNPLSAFRNILELLTNYYDELSKDKIRDTIKMLDENSSHLYKLLDNLLQWSRSQTGGIQLYAELQSIDAVIRMNISMMKISADKKGIKFIYEMKNDFLAYYDADLINTVLRNLFTNAIKFTPNGGSIIVSAKENGDYIEISVKDSGIGIKQEDIGKLFRIDVHHTTIGTLNEKGTGLGLILCKEFIEMHNGKISVKSIEGNGSTFIFTLPKKPF